MKLKNKFIKLNSADRLYELSIPIIALTGGIATGKSTVANYFQKANLPLLDADKLVKLVYQKDEVIEHIRRRHSSVMENNKIQFRKLREIFFQDQKVKNEIENLIYSHLPGVFKEELTKLGSPSFVIYDIPLLFEKNLESKFDLNILVYTDPEIQIERLIKRDHHTEEEARNIINQQISITEKKERSDLVIFNTKDLSYLQEQVNGVIENIFE
ncbi:MAG TPA: dephospho-CoA kinase [Bacteriovoracaceae bacterium]|nr:dephospho-CoA kinase [Bacteriovoracaceae bacterium]